MSLLNKYNKAPLFDFEEKEREFMSLKDLAKKFGLKKQHVIQALFINNKSRFGDSPIIVTDAYNINAPHHLLDVVKDMMNDTQLVEAINKRRIGFELYTYKNEYGENLSIKWIEF